MSPAALARVAEHGGGVEGAAGEMEGSGLGPGGVGLVASAVGCVVVVLERRATWGKTPCRRTEAGTARDGEGAAVNEAP